MAEEYFFAKDDKQFGPFTAVQLKKLADTGRLQPTDKVRKSSMAAWVPASAVKGLFQAAPTSPAPVVAPPAPAAAPRSTPPASAPEPASPVEEIAEAVLVEDDNEPLLEAEPLIPDEEPAVTPRRAAKRLSPDLQDVLLTLAKNPVGNLAEVYTRLGRQRALVVGSVASVVYVLGCVLYVYVVIPSFLGLMLSFGSADRPSGSTSASSRPKVTQSFDAKLLFKAAFAGATIPLGMFLASLAGRKLFRGVGSFESDLFLVGTALIPSILDMLLDCLMAGLLGVTLTEAYVVFWLFVFCCSILILYSGCERLHKMSPGASTLTVPLMLILPMLILDLMMRYVLT